MSRKDLEKSKETARILFMSGESQQSIADKVGVSRVTVSNWATRGEWKKIRAARTVTRPELVNKLLAQIGSMLDEALQEQNAEKSAGLADRLSKLASIVEKLDKKANVVDSIEVFTSFGNFLEARSEVDKELDDGFKKKVNKYHDAFINEQIAVGK